MTSHAKPWTRYVAIGDSFTEGMSDEDPNRPGSYIGWADRLAAQLAANNRELGVEFGYANLAIRGRKLADVVGPQLQAALDLEPDLVSIVAGGNDVMRPKVDLARLADQLEEAVATLRSRGIDVLMSTPADPGTGGIFKHLRPRMAVHTANVWGIAQRQGAFVVDMFTLRSLHDWRMWGTDRIHLSTEGHIRVAAQAYWALTDRVPERPWATPLPPAAPLPRTERIVENLSWAKEYAAPWVQRRLRGTSSGDTIDPKRPTIEPLD